MRETFKQTGINHFLSFYSNSNFCSTANFFPSKKVKQSGHKLILNATKGLKNSRTIYKTELGKYLGKESWW